MGAEFNIVVKVDPKDVVAGTKVVEGSLRRANYAALELNRTLRSVFGFYAITSAIKFVYDLTDGYTNLRNQIQMVSKNQANLNGQLDATYAIAQKTRTSWEATSTLYTRLARSRASIGASQKDLLEFTELINKAGAVGGSNPTETRAALLQLSQGLQSGKLAGEELRSIMEQMPAVAQNIAKGMDVPMGKLRQLGKEGKLVPRVVLDAIKKTAPEIEEQFAKMTPTIAQGFTVIHNAMTKFVGDLMTSSGAGEGLARVLIFIGEHMDTIGKAVIVLAQILGIQLARWAIAEVIAFLGKLAAAAVANPFTALLFVIASIVLALRQFGDQISTSISVMDNGKQVFATVGDMLRAIWSVLVETGEEIWNFVTGAWDALTSVFSDGLDATGVSLSLEDVLTGFMAFFYSVKAIMAHLKDLIMLTFGGIPVAFAEQFHGVLNKIIEGVQFLINQLIDAINGLSAIVKMPGAINDDALKRDSLQKKVLEKAKANTNYQISRSAAIKNGVSPDNPLLKVMDAWNQQDVADLQDAQEKRDRAFAAAARVSGRMSHVTLDKLDPNQLAGATDAMVNGLQDQRDQMIDEVGKALDDFRDRIKHQALNRQKKIESEIGTDRGPGDPADSNGKMKDEWTPILRRLEALEKKSNPIRKAEMEIAAAQKLLDRMENGGIIDKVFKDKQGVGHTIFDELISRGITASTVLSDLEKKLYDIAHPREAFVTKTIEDTAAMSGSVEQHELEAEVLKVINDLTEKGVELKIWEEQQLRRVIAIQQERERVWRIEQNLLQQINGPLKDYHRTLEAITNLQARGDISKEQGAFARYKAQQSYVSGNDDAYEFWRMRNRGTGIEGAVDAGTEAGGTAIANQINLAKTVEEAWVGTFQNIENAILHAAQTGNFEWQKLVESILQMLDRIALKILETQILKFLMSFSGGSGVGSIVAASNAVSSGMGGGMGSTDSTAFAGGFATGGSWTAPGGTGAPDSILMVARVNPRERVDFTPDGITPGQKSGGGRSSGDGGAPKIINIFDPQVFVNAMRTPQGRREVVNIVHEELGQIAPHMEKKR